MWMISSNEKGFNRWAFSEEGKPILKKEIDRVIGSNEFEFVKTPKGIVGQNDGRLVDYKANAALLVEPCVLDKSHVEKDSFYLADPDLKKYDTVSIMWISPVTPQLRALERIQVFYEFVNHLAPNRYKFFITSIADVTPIKLTLNYIKSFGASCPIAPVPQNSYGIPKHTLHIKEFSKYMGIPLSTSYQVCKRWKLTNAKGFLKADHIIEMFLRIEEVASVKNHTHLSFVPYSQLSPKMLFGKSVNMRLGNKGNTVRAKISPRWVTVHSSSAMGYRLLYSLDDVNTIVKGNLNGVTI